MIVHFSKNPLMQFVGIVFFNIGSITAFVLCHYYGYHEFEIPPIPLSILGGALAIFLGFKNSSAYDRWWEARKIWGLL